MSEPKEPKLSKFMQPLDGIGIVRVQEPEESGEPETLIPEVFSTHPDDLETMRRMQELGMSVDFAPRPVEQPPKEKTQE